MTRRTFTKPLLLVAASLLLAALVWALFHQTGNFEFLRLDDHDYTYRCDFVKDGCLRANVREAFTNVRHGGIWMPATYISYMCGISLFGPGAGAHHLVNVGIHALNAVLLLWLLFFVTADVGGTRSCASEDCGRAGARPSRGFAYFVAAFLLTAFWALHPQRAEAVAWIASRKELLCTTFVLGGLLCWLRARRREGWGWILALSGVYACFALACMSKPTAMCFPFLVLAVEGMMVSGDVRQATGDRRKATFDKRRTTFYIVNFTVFLLIAAAVGALAVYSQTHPEGHDVRALYSAPLGWRLLNAAVSVGLYIFQMFIPMGIHLDYRAVPGGWPVQGALGLASLAFVALGVAGVWWWLRRRARRRAGQQVESDRSALFFMGGVLLWFFASLAPTLGIFGSFGEHARADRFVYLPAMALPIAAMLLLGRARRDPPLGDAASRRFIGATGVLPVAGLAGLVLVVAVFFLVAYPIVASYRNDMTAFRHTLEADPGNWRALAHVGEAECAEGKLDDGIGKLRQSREVLPRDTTDAKLAYALMSRGRAEDWDEILNVCASLASDSDPARRDPRGQALEALGTAELKKRRWADAINHLVLSIRAPSRHYSPADAILKLAYALHNAGRRDEALEMFKWIKDRSGRADLAKRAREVLSVLEYSPRGMLFW
ncbi:MAG: hypothetical protein J6V72_11435 [Kiritimatiellae bacterium]|nr:hypothetical protein [Kiritimatiellia bacterium]